MGNLSKYKILVITGTRAEYGLLKSTIKNIESSKILSLCLVVTGMHTLKKFGYTLSDVEKDKFKIDHVVQISEDDDMLDSLNKEIEGIKNICIFEKPKGILVLGDRDEPFAGAIVGGHLKIPVFHIHGGDVSGYSIDEYIRHAITKFSHLHFTVSKKSHERVIKLGEEEWRVFNVGAPGLDNLRKQQHFSKKQLSEKLNLDKNKKWIMVLQHPTSLENISIRNQIDPVLKSTSKVLAEKIVIYPNSDMGSNIFIHEIEKYRKNKKFHIFKNLDRTIYLSLLKNSDLLIGNSSSGVIESGFFHLPVINVGNRQLDRECGKNIIHVDYTQKEINEAIEKALSPAFIHMCNIAKSPYVGVRVAEKIVKIIEKNINNPRILYKKFTYA
jgi:UDP-hydrolysing UDP-N-acetyl-D-glucosamine 2-epimerase